MGQPTTQTLIVPYIIMLTSPCNKHDNKKLFNPTQNTGYQLQTKVTLLGCPRELPQHLSLRQQKKYIDIYV